MQHNQPAIRFFCAVQHTLKNKKRSKKPVNNHSIHFALNQREELKKKEIKNKTKTLRQNHPRNINA